MPYPKSFMRHTMLWTLPGGEVASTSCAWAKNTSILTEPLDDAAILIGKGTSLWTAIKDQYSNQVAYVGSRVAWIGTTGNTVSTIDGAAAPVTGFGSEATLPTEVALCASLRTATNNRSGRGRMYLPPTKASSLTAAGRLMNASQDAIADGLAAYLSTEVVGGEDLAPVIASKTTLTLPYVTVVKVGDVFDAQRRRRDALSEVYEVRNL